MLWLLGRLSSLLKLVRRQVPSAAAGQPLQVGGLYAVRAGDELESFGVVKILVLEPSVVHLRVYATTYARLPKEIAPSTLTLNSTNLLALSDEELDKVRFGIGHMPLDLDDFLQAWQPVFLMQTAVTEEELEGFRFWQQEGGGVFGGLKEQ